MTWGAFKRVVDEHIDDDKRVDLIDVAGGSLRFLDFRWNEDGTVTIDT